MGGSNPGVAPFSSKRYAMGGLQGSRGPIDLYSGWDSRAKRKVTLQVLAESAQQDEQARKRFQREFRAASRVSSPYVCRYLDMVETGERLIPAIVTEPQEGMSLRCLLALGVPLSGKEVLFMARQLAEGLAACHRAGVIHRNLNPDHILVDEHKRIRIINFGLSHLDRATVLTATGLLMVSPDYAPPEAFMGSSFDVRVDIYAFGVILWEMLAGFNPYAGVSIVEMMKTKNAGTPPSLAKVKPGLPPWLYSLCNRLIASKAEQRPPSFSPVIDALNNQTPILPDPKRGDCCLHCGHRRHEQLPFCGFCGQSSGTGEDKHTVVLRAADDPESLRRFLQTTFPPGNVKVLEKKLKRMPVALSVDFSLDEAEWLVKQCREHKCVADHLPSSHFGFMLNSMFCLFALLLVLFFYKSFEPLEKDVTEASWYKPEFANPWKDGYYIESFNNLSRGRQIAVENYNERLSNRNNVNRVYPGSEITGESMQRQFMTDHNNLVYAFFIVLLLLRCMRYLYLQFTPWPQIPKHLWEGLQTWSEGKFVFIPSTNLVRLTTLIVCFTYSLYSLIDLFSVSYYEVNILNPAKIIFALLVLGVPRLIFGRVRHPILYPARKSSSLSRRFEGFELFDKLRHTLLQTPVEEYRDLLEKSMSCYLQIQQLATGTYTGAGDTILNLRDEAELAFRKVLQEGRGLARLHQLCQRDEQEMKRINEQEIRERLNGFRVVLGGLQTALLRMRRLSGDPTSHDPALRETLSLLRAEFSVLEILGERR